MLLVIDTNILVNALRSNNDASKSIRLMDDIYKGVHQMCVSSKILDEYENVLGREELHIPEAEVREVIQWINGSKTMHIILNRFPQHRRRYK